MNRPVLITGGTGFVGRALVRELARDYEIHVLARGSSDRTLLDGFAVHWHAGDLTDTQAVDAAVRAVCERAGADGAWLVHNAALISYRSQDSALQREVNVEGTRSVLSAARCHGITRAVHVSSVVAVGRAESGAPLDEDAPFNAGGLGVDYVTTKRAAEELALEFADALDLRVANPAAIFGPTRRSTNTERFLCSIAAGDLGFAAPPGGMSVVGLRDTASGIRLALEKGQEGRRYILSESYLTSKELFRIVAEKLGKRPPRFRVPKPAWFTLVAGARLIERVRRLELATPQALVMLGEEFRFTSGRARRELGWEPAPFAGVLDETILYLQEQGRLSR